MATRTFFSTKQQEIIVAAIREAERNTSGEIRVHLDEKCPNDPKSRAIEVFNEQKMYQTELRNGVLFYVATTDRKFAIIGDKGIDALVPANFWEEVRDAVLVHFRANQFAEGLVAGIHMAGQKLKTYFPVQHDDTDELTNDISFQNKAEE